MAGDRRAALPGPGAWVGQLWDRRADEVRAAARQLEDVGYGTIWLSEAYGREVLTAAAVVLAATDRLVVATGIASIWARDAMAMANAANNLAEAWPGRFVLGVGVSHRPLVDPRGHDYVSPLEHTEQYLQAMAAAPYRSAAPDPAPPVLVGALGDRMIGLAAAHADGVHPYLVTPAHTAHARTLLRPGQLLAPEQAVVLSTDAAAARAAGRAHLRTYLGLDNYVRSLRRQGFDTSDLQDGGSDRLVDDLIAWGDVGAVVARVAAHHAAGADHVAVQPLVGAGVPEPVQQLQDLAPALVGLPTGRSQR